MKKKNKLKVKTILAGLVVVAPIATVTSCNLAKEDDKDKTTVEVMPSRGSDSSNGNADGNDRDGSTNNHHEKEEHHNKPTIRSKEHTRDESNGNGETGRNVPTRTGDGSNIDENNRDGGSTDTGNTDSRNVPTHTGDGSNTDGTNVDSRGSQDRSGGNTDTSGTDHGSSTSKPKPKKKPEVKPKNTGRDTSTDGHNRGGETHHNKPVEKPTQPKQNINSGHDVQVLNEIVNLPKRVVHKEYYTASEIASFIKNIYDLETELDMNISSIYNEEFNIDISAVGYTNGEIKIKIRTNSGASQEFSVQHDSDRNVNYRVRRDEYGKLQDDKIENAPKLQDDVQTYIPKILEKTSSSLDLANKIKSIYHIKKYLGLDLYNRIKSIQSIRFILKVYVDPYDDKLVRLHFTTSSKGKFKSTSHESMFWVKEINLLIPYISSGWTSPNPHQGKHYAGDNHYGTIVVDDSFHAAHPNWNFFENEGYHYDFSKLRVAWRGMFEHYIHGSDMTELPSNFGHDFSSLEVIETRAFANIKYFPSDVTFPNLKVIHERAFFSLKSISNQMGRSWSNLMFVGESAFGSLSNVDNADFSNLRYLGVKSFGAVENIDNVYFPSLITLDDSALYGIGNGVDFVGPKNHKLIRRDYTFPKLKRLVAQYWNWHEYPIGLSFPELEEISASPKKSSNMGLFGTMTHWFNKSQIDMPKLRIIGSNSFNKIESEIPTWLFPNVEIIKGVNAFGSLIAPRPGITFPKLKSSASNSFAPLGIIMESTLILDDVKGDENAITQASFDTTFMILNMSPDPNRFPFDKQSFADWFFYTRRLKNNH